MIRYYETTPQWLVWVKKKQRNEPLVHTHDEVFLMEQASGGPSPEENDGNPLSYKHSSIEIIKRNATKKDWQKIRFMYKTGII